MTTSSKTLDTLVEDIYSVVKGSEQKIDDSLYTELAEDLTSIIKQRLSSPSSRRNHLSLSSIGKPLRRLWYDLKGPDLSGEEPASSRLKFLYGDIIESIVLWLAKVSGHSVTDRQKEITHHGVVGHIDSIIDGEVVDAKSASPRSYAKFATGSLVNEDPFGYLAQIEAYDEETGKGHPGFLAMNKVTGEICLYRPDKDFDLPNTKDLIDAARKALSKDEPPEQKCYSDVEDGKSGNRKLDKGCALCPYKRLCWPGLRTFKYSDGYRYLTAVEKEPKVEEIIYD